MRYALHLDMFEATLTCSQGPNCFSFNCALNRMYVEHNKPNWDKLQAISVLTSDSP